jgi:hypothetical protein
VLLNLAKELFILKFSLDSTFSVLELAHVNSKLRLLSGLAFCISKEHFEELMVVHVVIVLQAFELKL